MLSLQEIFWEAFDMKKIGKLVRDNIPQIINNSGKQCSFRILNDQEFNVCLRKKLEEEMGEFIEADSIEELADILEVIEAIAINKGFSLSDLINIKQNKAKTNGSFTKKIFLTEIDNKVTL